MGQCALLLNKSEWFLLGGFTLISWMRGEKRDEQGEKYRIGGTGRAPTKSFGAY